MRKLDQLLARNCRWAEAIEVEQLDFFEQSLRQRNPRYLGIGCSDSRVPTDQIFGLVLGKVFVQRNVANVVVHI